MVSVSRFTRAAFTFCLILSPLSSFAAEDLPPAIKWLERMMDSSRQLNYQGIFVYSHGDGIESMTILHKYDQRGEQEKLMSLNGDGRGVVRNNERVVCFLSQGQRMVLDNQRSTNSRLTAFPPVKGAELTRLGERYRFQLGGVDRVAGRVAQTVSITPTDNFRYGYRLWIDQESGLLLRSAMLDQNGETIEQLMFTAVALMAEIGDEHFAIDEQLLRQLEQKPQAAATSQAVADARDWRAVKLPQGFALRHSKTQRLPNGAQVQHMVVSDGLASVSVFIEPKSEKSATQPGPLRSGIINAYTSVVNNLKVLAVGEVPMETVRSISNAINSSMQLDQARHD